MADTVVKDGAIKVADLCAGQLASACLRRHKLADSIGTSRAQHPLGTARVPGGARHGSRRDEIMSALADPASERQRLSPPARVSRCSGCGASARTSAPVQALVGVDLDVPAGQVTALAGDNGAGKSVLIKCIVGIHAPDQGQIFWEGQPGAHPHAPRRRRASASRPSIRTSRSATTSTSSRTCSSAASERSASSLDEEDMETAARETLASLAVTTVRSIRQPVASLSGGQRQSVAIAKAVLWNSKLVIMDEPTAALGVAQTAMVLDLVRRLADRGLAVLIVSHNMNDVFEVADRIAVLHLGRMVAVRPAAELDRQIVVDLMTTGASTSVRRTGAAADPWPRSTIPRRLRAEAPDELDRRGGEPGEPGASPRAGRRLRSATTSARRSPASGPARAASCRWSAACSWSRSCSSR